MKTFKEIYQQIVRQQTNKDDDNTFIKYFKEIKPIKKTNRITKLIPKQKSATKTTEISKRQKTYKVIEKTKNLVLPTELKIRKTHINKKLRKGKILINIKIDFHGCSLEEAKELFLSTIINCFIKNYRCILFITGKGIVKRTQDEATENKLYFGKIRNVIVLLGLKFKSLMKF